MAERLIIIALLLVACDAERSRSPNDKAGDGGASIPSTDAGRRAKDALECFEAASCIDATDCPPGSRCNLAVGPPRCQRLFCGAADTRCSEDGLCANGHRCEEQLCTPCLDCGGACVVIANDPNHCGGCDQRVRRDQRCENGFAICKASDEIDCGDDCANLRSSSGHCGVCGNSCGAGSCFSGACAFLETWMERPTTCSAVCRQQRQRPCTVLDAFPIVSKSGDGLAAGVAAYGTGPDALVVEIESCEDTPTDVVEGASLTAMLCACSIE